MPMAGAVVNGDVVAVAGHVEDSADAAAEAMVTASQIAEAQPVASMDNTESDAQAGRNRAALRRRRHNCSCWLGETCHICGRCLERHCRCGDRPAHTDAVWCRESRPCNCAIVSADQRCSLCLGCRQPAGQYSHCRCVAHRTYFQARKQDNAVQAPPLVKRPCNCWDLVAAKKAKRGLDQDKIQDRRDRVQRLKRGLGIPSHETLYGNKIRAVHGTVDASDSSEEEEEDSLSTVLYRNHARRLLKHRPPPYRLLFGDVGASYAESIQPSNGPLRGTGVMANVSDITQEKIERGLQNALHAQVRDETKPLDDLVDYLVYMSSVKVTNAPELIGSFEDTAAVAAAIVVEEYAKQIVEDTMVHERPLFLLSRPVVEEFATMVLQDMEWRELLVREGKLRERSGIATELAAYLLEEFTSVRALAEPTATCQLRQWMDELAAEHVDRALKLEQQASKPKHDHQAPHATPGSKPTPTPHAASAVRLGVKANAAFGTPEYHFSLTGTLSGSTVHVSAEGIESCERAMERVRVVSKTLELQEEKLAKALDFSVEEDEDPIVRELYSQLRAQVKDSLAQQQRELAAMRMEDLPKWRDVGLAGFPTLPKAEATQPKKRKRGRKEKRSHHAAKQARKSASKQ